MGLTRSQTIMIVILLVGTFLVVLNQTLLSPALASIMSDLSIDATTVQYVMSIYSLVEAVVIPLSAYLIGRFTTRQLFISGLCIFTAGSLFAAVSPFFIFLLIGRIFQAIAAGMFMPMIFTVILLVFPRERRGAGMGLTTLIIGFAPAVGPTLSGILVDSIGWRMLFVVVTIISFILVLFGIKFLQNYGNFDKTTFDKLSVILSSLGLICLLYGLSTFASSENILIPIILIIVGIIIIAIFVRRQLKLKTPLLQVHVLKTRNYRIAVIINMINFGTLVGLGTLLPLYLQNVRGFSALDTGLVMLPGALIGAIVGMLAGRLFDRFGVRKCAIPGVCIFFAGALGLTIFSMDTTLLVICLIYSILAIGNQFLVTPLNTWGINSLQNSVIQHANAVTNTLNQVTASFMTALIVSLSALGWVIAPNEDQLMQTYMGDKIGFFTLAILVFFVFLAVLFLVRKPKSETAQQTGYTMGQSISVDRTKIPVKNVMQKEPYFVSDKATIREVSEILVAKKTSGLPIVDDKQKVVGFISDGDIMKYLGQSNNILDSSYMLYQVKDPDSFAKRVCELIDLNVMTVATKNVLTLNSDTLLENACTILSEKKIKKAPIVENDKLVGTISRSDIIRSTMANLSMLEVLAKKYN